MEKEFRKAFASLNQAQRQAVEAIDGPVLVIAGPGTGKTQLVSTRVGYILQKTDTLPNNILLLTFTEAGVEAMRERLINLIGQQAYEVNISTYHAFGSELIRQYPDFFAGTDARPIDDLSQSTILQSITGRLPYDNPLRYSGSYQRDIVEFISDCKRALLDPDDIFKITAANLKYIEKFNEAGREVLDKLGTVSKKTVPQFENFLEVLELIKPPAKMPDAIRPLGRYAKEQLEEALAEFADTQKTYTLTAWKNAWLEKDREGDFIFAGRRQNLRLVAAAEVYDLYQKGLEQSRLFDYEDMILRAISTLEKHRDFKYTLAEQYQYIMLDEFQDTNPAQFKLIELLTDHPANEGRPNVLAVGDDDQAIYAFQGADHANMLNFAKHYEQVKTISLIDNYRSQPGILETAQNISDQINQRLHFNFKGINKKLKAQGSRLKAVLEVREFKTDGAQYDWIAEEIEQLIKKSKIPANEIAVLAPKHRYLIELLPYLASHDIALHYEKRENVLDSPIVRQLEQMARLVLALRDNSQLADHLWAEVISYDFWDLTTEKIWQISWLANETSKPWTSVLLEDKTTHDIANFFLRLKDKLGVTVLEEQLDALIGINGRSEAMNLPISSPMFSYYFERPKDKDAITFTRFLSNLNVLRQRLREHQRAEEQPLNLENFIDFIDANRTAEINILDSSPYYESPDAVQLMTAYGAKGREFRAVFVMAAIDEVWGSASRNLGSRISLPENVKFIRYQGASEDERLRLLYVAATRAKTNLYFTSYQATLAGRDATRLKYLQITEEEGGQATSGVLPTRYNKVITDDKEEISAEALLNYWTDRHQPPLKPKLEELLQPRLKRYQLSPTHLNHFTDIVNNGPTSFFIYCLLYFKRAPSIDNQYGTAVHSTLRWLGGQVSRERRLPRAESFLRYFEMELSKFRLKSEELALLKDRGNSALKAWYLQRSKLFTAVDKFEISFGRDGIFMGDAHLNGNIDRLAIDEKHRTIDIYDFKTGKAYSRWSRSNVKLHNYRQQLLFYKYLVENSRRFKDYRVDKLWIEFVEPDDDGRILPLELVPSAEEIALHSQLVQSVWRHIMKLDWPDVSKYSPTTAGINQFESDLISQYKESSVKQSSLLENL